VTTFQWTNPASLSDAYAGTGWELEADRVEFTSGHVVFRDFEHRIILAVRNERVDDLHQLPEVEDEAERTVCGARYMPGPGLDVIVCQKPSHPPDEDHDWSEQYRQAEDEYLRRRAVGRPVRDAPQA
jgi:hypothetical protein